ncbi:hypothetical protein IVB08_34715 [Bradyrhizobium sp. 173]|uniref:hypothetical protein n=1 Tax=Bradyrhizobium sp. 173 TaxID=2782644 RepID=UPI001FF83DDB|nr:hypothetical protein [Bradyrhizobium sp. 173]MCK1569013.1 hypothetical protein [Bradyrhizobium sp. 173]
MSAIAGLSFAPLAAGALTVIRRGDESFVICASSRPLNQSRREQRNFIMRSDYDLDTLVMGWGAAVLGFGSFLWLLAHLH